MVTSHMVKCLYCGEYFDAQPADKDILWFKPRNNRYAHKQCGQEQEKYISQEDKDFDDLYRYVKQEQGINFNFVQFQKIVEAWKRDYNYTYSGMLKSLQYFYEVKKNDKTKFKEGSLGIIPFCYVQAYNYYYNIYEASMRAGTGDYNRDASRIVEIEAPAAKTPPIKLFDMKLEEDDEE